MEGSSTASVVDPVRHDARVALSPRDSLVHGSGRRSKCLHTCRHDAGSHRIRPGQHIREHAGSDSLAGQQNKG